MLSLNEDNVRHTALKIDALLRGTNTIQNKERGSGAARRIARAMLLIMSSMDRDMFLKNLERDVEPDA